MPCVSRLFGKQKVCLAEACQDVERACESSLSWVEKEKLDQQSVRPLELISRERETNMSRRRQHSRTGCSFGQRKNQSKGLNADVLRVETGRDTATKGNGRTSFGADREEKKCWPGGSREKRTRQGKAIHVPRLLRERSSQERRCFGCSVGRTKKTGADARRRLKRQAPDVKTPGFR